VEYRRLDVKERHNPYVVPAGTIKLRPVNMVWPTLEVVFATPVKGCEATWTHPFVALIAMVVLLIGVGLYHKVAVFAPVVPVQEEIPVMITSEVLVF
jgi:hypothetical protein